MEEIHDTKEMETSEIEDGTRHRSTASKKVTFGTTYGDTMDPNEYFEKYKVKSVASSNWKGVNYECLPKWLQDNEYILRGHRPPLESFLICFKSIFRIHTETGNIWTHLLGCGVFILLTAYFLTRPVIQIAAPQKIVFAIFFAGGIACLGFSFVYHTLICHSESVKKQFKKLDYVGIALQIMGSFFPWLYYSFYCERSLQIIYMGVTFVLGASSITVSLLDKFGTPRFRPVRAAVFVTFGLSSIAPVVHYIMIKSFASATSEAYFGWLVLMGFLYIFGAVLYAARIPERWSPGKYDIWFHSHQFFHTLVVAAALVSYHGVSELAFNRLTKSECV